MTFSKIIDNFFWKTKEYVEGNLLVFAQTFLKIVIMEFGFFHIVN